MPEISWRCGLHSGGQDPLLHNRVVFPLREYGGIQEGWDSGSVLNSTGLDWGCDIRFDISFKLRIGVQAILKAIIMNYTGLTLSHVGDVFGLGVLDFPIVVR